MFLPVRLSPCSVFLSTEPVLNLNTLGLSSCYSNQLDHPWPGVTLFDPGKHVTVLLQQRTPYPQVVPDPRTPPLSGVFLSITRIESGSRTPSSLC